MDPIQQLIINTKDQSAPLSKKVAHYNKLLTRIQRAENKLADTKNKLEQKLIEFAQKVLPVHTQRCELQLAILQEILQYMTSNKLSNTREEVLLQFCSDTAHHIGMSPHRFSDEKMEEFKIVLKKIHPDLDLLAEGFDEENPLNAAHKTDERTKTLEETKDMIQVHYEMMGIEINLDDITSDMTDDEIAEAIDLRIRAVDPNYHGQKKKSKKKSKAQIRKDAAKNEFNEMKDKSFSSMYKSLVKLIHPDGEQDEQLKEKKSEWMKRLTVAYKNKDIKTLMLIELEWLHGAKDELEKMSEEKMSYFIDMLKTQATEIEQQTAMLYVDPRYSAMAFFTHHPQDLDSFRPAACLNLIKTEMAKDDDLLNDLRKSPTSARKTIMHIIENNRFNMQEDFW